MNLKEWCEKQNVTIKSVCEALGQDYAYFIQQVRGEKRFTVQMAREIRDYTGGDVTLDDILPYKKPVRCSDPRCNRLLHRKYW